MRLAGEVAIVTGASRGIGRACALSLATAGARVALVSRREGPLAEVAAEIVAQAGVAQAFPGDISDEGFVGRLFEEVERKLGPVTVLVGNAAVLEVAPVAEMSTAAFDRVLDTNLRAAFLCAREAVRRMVPRGKGRLIQLSSISATLGTPKLAAYCASKWGLNGLVKALAEELRGTGVLSMGVAPGSVDTEMLKQSGFPPDMQPEDVATVVRFLASEAPAAMQGSIVEMFG